MPKNYVDNGIVYFSLNVDNQPTSCFSIIHLSGMRFVEVVTMKP